jgi:hypothetical protein
MFAIAKPYTENQGFNDIQLIVGHGYNLMEVRSKNKMPDYNSLVNNLLKKPVGKCIVNNANFFNSLNDICNIFSYGFSFSDVDMPYIFKIVESIGDTSKRTWFLNDFNYQDHEILKTKIKSSGFKGKFDIFHIN